MEEGKVADGIVAISWTATILAGTPLYLEVFHIIFFRAHRASLSPPFPTFPHLLPPAETLCPDPTEAGVTDGFV